MGHQHPWWAVAGTQLFPSAPSVLPTCWAGDVHAMFPSVSTPGPCLVRQPPANKPCSLLSTHMISTSSLARIGISSACPAATCRRVLLQRPRTPTHGSKEGATATKESSKVVAKHCHRCNSARINRSPCSWSCWPPSTCISVTVQQWQFILDRAQCSATLIPLGWHLILEWLLHVTTKPGCCRWFCLSWLCASWYWSCTITGAEWNELTFN